MSASLRLKFKLSVFTTPEINGKKQFQFRSLPSLYFPHEISQQIFGHQGDNKQATTHANVSCTYPAAIAYT